MKKIIHSIQRSALISITSLSATVTQAETDLDTIVVLASDQALSEVAQPIQVLTEEQLKESAGSTLGEILETLPGVSNSSFGSGVGRPVIRGMTGNRVKMAINGNDAADLSAMSSDHAPMAEAANAKQVEVIYGPSTLLFGSGAIGGVVNVADDRFHEFQYHGFKPTLRTRISSADAGREVAGSVVAGTGQGVMHLSGFSRESSDFEVGDSNQFTDKVSNTDTESQGVNLALNWVNDRYGYSGVALSTLKYEYGVPNPEGERATVAPEQIKLDVVSAWHFLTPNLELWKTQFSLNDYEHVEGTNGQAVGFFEQDTMELKSTFHLIELFNWQTKFGLHATQKNLGVCHDHDGCPEVPDYSNLSWDGSTGANLTDISGFTFAHDTPMPLTETKDLAAFFVLERPWEKGLIELGGRFDSRTISSDPDSIRPSSRQENSYYDDKTFNTSTLSAAFTWAMLDQHKLGASIARSQRAPDAQELFWNGDHHSTFSYQLDNPDLNEETALSLDLTWQYFGDHNQARVSTYYYDFNDYIYNDLKAVTDPNHQNPVYRHEQADAWFAGFESSVSIPLPTPSEAWTLQLMGDYVKAQLKEGANKNIPRTPPASFTLGIEWNRGHWIAGANIRAYAEQIDTAENESKTDAYQTLNAQVSYKVTLANVPLDMRIKGTNLTNEFGRNHVSYLKEYSPVMGRNVQLELSTNY